MQYEHAGDWEKIDEAVWDHEEAHDRCEELGLVWSPDWWEWQVYIPDEEETGMVGRIWRKAYTAVRVRSVRLVVQTHKGETTMFQIDTICGFSPEMDEPTVYSRGRQYCIIWKFKGEPFIDENKAYASSRQEAIFLIAGMLMQRVGTFDAFTTAGEAVENLSQGEPCNQYIDVDLLVQELEN